jgi:hypothetical protein
MTIIMIAHCLSTICHTNQVIYLENSSVGCEESFEEVKEAVPVFYRQAKPLGM